MLSKVFVTYQIDDLEAAVDELISNLKNNFTLRKNSCGILFCESDMELLEFVSLLKNRLDFDIIGCSTIATMDNREGLHTMSITFIVLTDDECDFSVAVSGIITPENIFKEVENVYKNSIGKLSGDPKLIFALPPHFINIMLDEYTNIFNEIAPGIPVLGGLPSYLNNGDMSCTLYNSSAYTDRLVIITISGNIKPVITVQTLEGTSVDRKRKVTLSDKNIFYKVGNQTFAEYLSELGIDFAKLCAANSSLPFYANPLLVENVKNNDGDSFSFIRAIHRVNFEDGSGISIGLVPQGATISLSTLNRDEIEKTALSGIESLTNEMKKEEQEGYKYSTILAISCIARYQVMLPKVSIEADIIIPKLPKDITFAGFYSYGEIAPLPSKKLGSVNFAHNETLVLCAF